ncbi:hypothetical protein [Paenarthrobacter sp. NPDC058040]|uniref:hypothetical protein n=1 Tax=unclassified Paenarthrobacter TaxID=2634190 RepID=UPI0036DC9169
MAIVQLQVAEEVRVAESAHPPVAPSPAPRHLRKRRFRGETRTSRMAGYQPQAGASPFPVTEAAADVSSSASTKQTAVEPVADVRPLEQTHRELTLRQKRRVALALVILVSVSIPLLALALIFVR